MKPPSNIIVVCLLIMVCLPSGMSGPLGQLDQAQVRKTAPAQKIAPACLTPRGPSTPSVTSKPVDLCLEASVLNHTSGSKQWMEIESLNGRRKFWFGEHEDVALALKRDEAVFSCSNAAFSFSIDSIESVGEPCVVTTATAPQTPTRQPPPTPPSPFPFSACFKEQIGKIQGPGTQLHSGAPTTGSQGWYKYSFTFGPASGGGFANGGTKIDPHLIVTGGNSPLKPPQPCPVVGPTNSQGQHPESKN